MPPKTPAERSKAYRDRKCSRAHPAVKPPPKSVYQRVREYRARQKALKGIMTGGAATSRVRNKAKNIGNNSTKYADLHDTTVVKIEPLDSPEIDVITPTYDIWDTQNDSPSPPITPIASIQPTLCKLVQATTKANLCLDRVQAPISEPPFKKPRTEDRFDVYGKNIAYKLREMDKIQRILAEKIINDALFEGEMGALTRQHKVVDESKAGSHPELQYTAYPHYTAEQRASPNSSRSESPSSASMHLQCNVSTADESQSRLVLP